MGTTDPVYLELTAGLPYARRIRMTDGKLAWPLLTDFEVRSHVRAGKDTTSPLLYDLAVHMTPSYDVNDILVDISLTGAQTRLIPPGNFDVIISDPGVEDVRAVRLASGKIKVASLITAAVDV